MLLKGLVNFYKLGKKICPLAIFSINRHKSLPLRPEFATVKTTKKERIEKIDGGRLAFVLPLQL